MFDSRSLTVPFFFDKNLTKNFKIFGQVLYVYFDPTFRRHVSVIDVGLKQKASIFVDEVFRYRNFFFNNNFQFLFTKKKDIFSLKPVHFLNSKNERVLKRKYLFSSDTRFSFLKLNKFSFLTLKYFNVKNENLFNFKNEAVLNYVMLKSLGFNRVLNTHKIYSLIALSVFKRSKQLSYKSYACLRLFAFFRSLVTNLVLIYKALLYLLYLRGVDFSCSNFLS